jgi:hypothetical protein
LWSARLADRIGYNKYFIKLLEKAMYGADFAKFAELVQL